MAAGRQARGKPAAGAILLAVSLALVLALHRMQGMVADAAMPQLVGEATTGDLGWFNSSSPRLPVCLLAPCDVSAAGGSDERCDVLVAALLAAEGVERSGLVPGGLSLRLVDTRGSAAWAVARYVYEVEGRCGLVVGAMRSSVSSPLAVLASSAAVPQAMVSYGSTAQDLGQARSIYPYFGRVVPQDGANADTFVDFVVSQGWRAFALLARNDAWGRGLAGAVRTSVTRYADSDSATFEILDTFYDDHAPESIDDALDAIEGFAARIVMLAASEGAMESILEGAAARGMLGDSVDGTPFVWVSIEKPQSELIDRASDPARMRTLVRGMFSILPSLPGSKERADFESSWPTANVSTAMLADVTDDAEVRAVVASVQSAIASPSMFSYLAYDAVWMAAHAIRVAFAAAGANATGWAAAQHGVDLWHALRQVEMVGTTGNILIGEEGNRAGHTFLHEVRNVVDDQGTELVVGNRSGATGLQFQRPLTWQDGTTSATTTPRDGRSCPPRMAFVDGKCGVRIATLTRSHDVDGTLLASWRRVASAMVHLAIEHVNAGNTTAAPAVTNGLLPAGFSVAAVVGDTHQSGSHVIKQILAMSRSSDLAAVVAYSKSSTSIAGAQVAQAVSAPYVSSSATSTTLSDTERFPLFARSVPPDSATAVGTVALLRYLGIRRVAIVAENDAFGAGFVQDFSLESGILQMSVSVHFFGAETGVADAAAQAVIGRARVFVLVGQDADIVQALAELKRRGAYGQGYAFFVTDATSPEIVHQAAAPEGVEELVDGFVRVQANIDLSTDNYRALQRSWSSLDRQAFIRKYAYLNLTVDMFDSDVGAGGAYLYDAALIAAVASAATLDDRGAVGTGPEILERMLEIDFQGASGRVVLDPLTGNRRVDSVVIGVQSFHRDELGVVQVVDVGSLSTANGAVTLSAPIVWPGGSTTVPDDGSACVSGQYFNGTTGHCETCAPGSIVAPGGAECNLCPPGTFAPSHGMSACVSCDSTGGYSEEFGAAQCSVCPENSARGVGSLANTSVSCMCLPGFFALANVGGSQCGDCPNGSICQGGLAPPYPESGWWSSPERPDIAFRCLPSDRDECVGGPQYSCKNGSVGTLCAECGTGYFALGMDCFKCPGEAGARWVMTLFGVLVVVLAWMAINHLSASNDSLDLALLFAQVTNHVQEFKVEWPASLWLLTVVFTLLNFDVDVMTPNCIIQWGLLSGWVLQMILPLAFITVSVGVASGSLQFYRRVKAERQQKEPSKLVTLGKRLGLPATKHQFRRVVDWCWQNGIIMCAILYNTICRKCFEAFYCVSENGAGGFVAMVPSVQCGSKHHRAMQIAAVFGIIFFVIGFPSLCYLVLSTASKTDSLTHVRFLRRYGFLFKRYKPYAPYWELVLLARRVAITLVLVYYQYDAFRQSLAGMTVMLFALLVQLQWKPFVDERLNQVELLGMSTTLSYLIAGTLFQAKVSFAGLLALGLRGFVWFTLGTSIIIAGGELWNQWLGVRAAKLLARKATAISPALSHGRDTRVRQSRDAAEADAGISMQTHMSSSIKSQSSGRVGKMLGIKRRDPSPRHSSSRVAAQLNYDSDDDDIAANLADSALSSSLIGRHLLKWVSGEGDNMEKLKGYVKLDAWLDPYVAENSWASVYSRRPIARFWHKLLLKFPWLFDCLVNANEENIKAFATVMRWLQPYYDKLAMERPVMTIYHLIQPNARAPMCIWFAMRAKTAHRQAVAETLKSIYWSSYGRAPLSASERVKKSWQSAARRSIIVLSATETNRRRQAGGIVSKATPVPRGVHPVEAPAGPHASPVGRTAPGQRQRRKSQLSFLNAAFKIEEELEMDDEESGGPIGQPKPSRGSLAPVWDLESSTSSDDGSDADDEYAGTRQTSQKLAKLRKDPALNAAFAAVRWRAAAGLSPTGAEAPGAPPAPRRKTGGTRAAAPRKPQSNAASTAVEMSPTTFSVSNPMGRGRARGGGGTKTAVVGLGAPRPPPNRDSTTINPLVALRNGSST